MSPRCQPRRGVSQIKLMQAWSRAPALTPVASRDLRAQSITCGRMKSKFLCAAFNL